MNNSGSGPLSGNETNSAQLNASPKQGESLYWILFCILILLLNSFQRLNDYRCMAGDMGLYLQCGQLLLAGKRPYVDFFDTNPPLIMYLSMIPAMVQNLLGGNIVFWFQISMLAISLITASILALFLIQAPKRYLFHAALGCISLMSMLSMFDFGQREFLFFLFFLPYFFFSITRTNGQKPGGKFYLPLSILIGILAGIGLSLKPHFLIFLLFLEGWTLKNCGLSYLKFMLRPELLACILTGALYGLHFLFLPADIKYGFFDKLMPMMVTGFSAYDSDKPFFLSGLWVPLTFYSLIAIALLAINFKKMPIAFPLLLMLASSILLIVIQAKNWSYYGIPLLGFSTLSYLILVFSITPGRKARFAQIACLAVCAIYSMTQFFWTNKVASAMDFSFAPVVKKFASKNDKVLFLDTTSCPWYAFASFENIMPACRYMWLFPVSMSEYELNLKKNERIKPAILAREEEAIKNILTDAQKNKPPLIVCRKTGAYKMPEQTNLYLFLKDKGLAPLFKQYKIQQEDANYVYLTPNPD
ncbi:MAG: hypothetical protein SFY67_09835 [Candidatus Melainabacteria bacterium]|nr:hypothetical protein [Candidatus Melainabacteria bacterium]